MKHIMCVQSQRDFISPQSAAVFLSYRVGALLVRTPHLGFCALLMIGLLVAQDVKPTDPGTPSSLATPKATPDATKLQVPNPRSSDHPAQTTVNAEFAPVQVPAGTNTLHYVRSSNHLYAASRDQLWRSDADNLNWQDITYNKPAGQ